MISSLPIGGTADETIFMCREITLGSTVMPVLIPLLPSDENGIDHIGKAQARNKHHAARRWLGFSELVEMPLARPYIMVTGPRWNCHAVLGVLGPVQVQSTLSINVKQCRMSAGQWTVVLYNSQRETVCSTGSTTDTGTVEWRDLTIEEGAYSIALRYYECVPHPVFPAVQIDRHEYTATRPK